MFTNFGKEQVAIMLGSEVTNKYISYFAVGTGSATEAVANVTLAGSEFKRFAITGSPNFSVGQEVQFQGDLNSVQASGLIMTEWGMFASGAINAGSLFQREQLNGSIVCDGTIEIQLLNTVKVT